MSEAPAVNPRPIPLHGSRGALAALYYTPTSGMPVRGCVLVAPAFAEEMNRCRAMVSLLARRLGDLGIATLVLDPFGTGDSAGEFSQATWGQWRADLLLGVDWLDRHGGGCTAVLGIRLGAIMAAHIARERPQVRRLVLWQPVLNGKTFYTQFLRIRLAAEMNQATRAKSTNELRQISLRGEVLEVSGYEIGPALAGELDTLAFDAATLPSSLSIGWLEVQAGVADISEDADAGAKDNRIAPPAAEGTPSVALLPASTAAVAKLKAHGIAVEMQVVVGPAFWHVHERELAPELIEASAAYCEKWLAMPAPAVTTDPALDADGDVARAERLVGFACGAEHLVGCLHHGTAATPSRRGVVIVVAGGPQYRAGAHRQFVNLARLLASQGQPVLRFDLRGMGDSSGSYGGFQVSSADIQAAVDTLLQLEPQLQDVVLVGECESASGILFYAWQDPRVTGAVLVNPWVRSPEGQAQVIIKNYYFDRLRQRDFWHKLVSGRFDVLGSARSFVKVLRDYVQGRRQFKKSRLARADDDMAQLPLPVKTAVGLSRFKGRVLLLMSGHDYIAREFDEVTSASTAWAGLLQSPRLQRTEIANADHTFSRREWKDAAAAAITGWIRSW